ncbi:hypothetical protein [Dactylosporangium sp. CA-233914]|uniref:hypothetical protein n=1 Tax=Dactylosporangium sp. CA-233914 TaxID=3239934 RepID=UPI003D8CC610
MLTRRPTSVVESRNCRGRHVEPVPRYSQTQQTWTTTSANVVDAVQLVVLDGGFRAETDVAGDVRGGPVGGADGFGLPVGTEVADGPVVADGDAPAVVQAVTEAGLAPVGIMSPAAPAGLRSGTMAGGTVTVIRPMATTRPRVRHRWASTADAGLRSRAEGAVSPAPTTSTEGV